MHAILALACTLFLGLTTRVSGWQGVGFGFKREFYSAVEGRSFEVCLVGKPSNGCVLDQDEMVTVTRTYEFGMLLQMQLASYCKPLLQL